MINASSNPETLNLPSIATDEVTRAVDDGALLITATPRLAAEWKRHLLLEKQKNIIETPKILFWDEWISHHLHHQAEPTVALTRRQELLLWEKVIQRDLKTKPLPHISLKGLAKCACEAYLLMQEYSIEREALFPGGEESEALARWIDDIHAALNSEVFAGRMLAADITSQLLTHISKLKMPKQIILDGFETIAPVRQQLLQAIQEQHCTLFTYQPDATPATPRLTACSDEASELYHLSQRIQALLQKNDSARIAILTCGTSPNITALRRQLNRTLLPETQKNPMHDMEAIVTQGTPLSDWPMIQQTLHLLGLTGQKYLPFRDFSSLLFSPWLNGFEEEQIERAKLDARLRQQNRHHISLTQLVESQELTALPALVAIIKALLAWDSSARSASQWIKATHLLLQEIGIVQAGLEHQAERSTIEIKLMNKFRDTLTSLVAVDAVHTTLSWSRFISLLRTACTETSHAHSARFTNVTLLPMTQIAGLRFDHIFVLGLDEQAFPPITQPQPLLPLALQRQHKLPMNSGTLQYDSATWLWQQLLLAAPEIEISYARQHDEQAFRCSPFVKEMEEHTSVSTKNAEHSVQFEAFDDMQKVPLCSDEQPRGGARIIQDQSDCPFRAFVTHRLGISTLGETQPGIEATTKGSLVHLALEFIWKELGRQSALLVMDDETQSNLIDNAIEHAWKACRSRPSSEGQQNIQKLEAKRMQQLLSQWLEMEKRRPSFEVIETEKHFELSLPEKEAHTFTLKLMADRIDRDQCGRQILLDYKTGAKQSPGKWLGERMEQPQLPLYAVAANLEEHDAVAFASVRSGDDMGFEGLSGDDTEIPGIAVCDGKRGKPADWHEVLKQWRDSLNALATEFADGRSDVAPRNSKACTYCSFEAICRIEETGFSIESEESE